MSMCLLMALPSSRTNAQSTEGLGPIVLRLPASARMASLANVGLTSNDGDAMFYNPALLNSARGTAVSLQTYGSAATTGSMGMISNAGTYNIGIGVQFLSWSAQGVPYGEAVRYGASHLSDDGLVAATSTALTFGVGRTWHGRRIGVNAKYVEDRIGAAHDATMAFDAGVMLPSFWRGNLTLVARNIGQGLRLDGVEGRLPTAVGFGYGTGMFSLSEHYDIGMQTELLAERGGFVRPAGGAELGYVPIEGVSIVARAGLRLPREKDESLATGGFGVTIDRISIDYALETVSRRSSGLAPIGITHQITQKKCAATRQLGPAVP